MRAQARSNKCRNEWFVFFGAIYGHVGGQISVQKLTNAGLAHAFAQLCHTVTFCMAYLTMRLCLSGMLSTQSRI